MKKFFSIILFFYCMSFFSLSVFATGAGVDLGDIDEYFSLDDSTFDNDYTDYTIYDLLNDLNEYIPPQNSGSVAYDNGEFISQDDLDNISSYAVIGSAYPGTWTGSVLDYFGGIIEQNPGSDYVAWRSSRYVYNLFYGTDFVIDGDRFTGSGHYVSYNTEGSNNLLTRGVDSFNFTASGGFVYTNVSSDYSALPSVSEVSYTKLIGFALVLLIGLWIIDRIFFRRR